MGDGCIPGGGRISYWPVSANPDRVPIFLRVRNSSTLRLGWQGHLSSTASLCEIEFCYAHFALAPLIERLAESETAILSSEGWIFDLVSGGLDSYIKDTPMPFEIAGLLFVRPQLKVLTASCLQWGFWNGSHVEY